MSYHVNSLGFLCFSNIIRFQFLFIVASHCADLYSMSPYDSPEMTAVKERIRGLFYMWADEYRNETIITNV